MDLTRFRHKVVPKATLNTAPVAAPPASALMHAFKALNRVDPVAAPPSALRQWSDIIVKPVKPAVKPATPATPVTAMPSHGASVTPGVIERDCTAFTASADFSDYDNLLNLAGAGIPASAEPLHLNSVLNRKTGAVMGRVSLDGNDAAEYEFSTEFSLARMSSPVLATSLGWLREDSEALDLLYDTDRAAYVTYLIGKLARLCRDVMGEVTLGAFTAYHDNPEHLSNDVLMCLGNSSPSSYPCFDPTSYWALARASAWVSGIAYERLDPLATALCRIVGMGKTAARTFYRRVARQYGKRPVAGMPNIPLAYLFLAPDYLAREAYRGTLIAYLSKSYSDTLATIVQGKAAAKRAYGDTKDKTPLAAAKGPSQVRNQRRTKQSFELAQAFALALQDVDLLTGKSVAPKIKPAPKPKAVAEHNATKSLFAAVFQPAPPAKSDTRPKLNALEDLLSDDNAEADLLRDALAIIDEEQASDPTLLDGLDEETLFARELVNSALGDDENELAQEAEDALDGLDLTGIFSGD